MTKNKHKPVERAKTLLESHKFELIAELGHTAFDLLTPREAADILEVNTKLLPDLIRQKWLEAVPGKNIGSAHQYYRWRVEFIKRYRGHYKRTNKATQNENRADMVNIGVQIS